MGLLAPLYALAALAIAAPVLFHLIRRQPRGQVEFSSLMFLQPSPPRLTRRSRLDNLWLLLIRAAALALIALAFARPFLRSAKLAEAQPAGRQILLLLDTSGSMQREDVWLKALGLAKKYVDGLGEADHVGLATFDTELRVVVPLPERRELADRSNLSGRAAVRQELDKLRPSYRGTDLAEPLMAAADLLQAHSATGSPAEASECELVLVSDLHEGAGLDALQGYAWPENVRLDIRPVAPDRVGNARATLMQETESDAGEAPLAKQAADAAPVRRPGSVRIHVENNANSSASTLNLRWLARGETLVSEKAATSSPSFSIQVPPGQARVVPVPAATGEADRLVLSGDEAAFDNVVYVPHTAPRQERLGFVGRKRDKTEDDLFFFLSRVPLSTPVRNVTVERLEPAALIAATTDESLAGLVIEWPMARAHVSAVEDFVRTGRPVVVVLSRPVAAAGAPPEAEVDAPLAQADSRDALASLLANEQAVPIEEAPGGDFALLSDIDFRHPLFQPLADAKFNDFGKVRFWAHRVVTLPAPEQQAEQHTEQQAEDHAEQHAEPLRVLARFDDHAPAIVERRIGRGHLWVLTAGWQANASQLALSTKFVPLLYGMLDPDGRAFETDSVYEVGERIDVAAGATLGVTTQDGSAVETEPLANSIVLEQPGIYWLSEDGKRRQIAVALPLSESQLDPLDLDRFAQYGVVTGVSASHQERQAAARFSQVSELENRQKLWRWLLVGALGLLILETLLAARRERSAELGVA